jgi:arsenate reductase
MDVEFEDYRYLDLGIDTDDFDILLQLKDVIRISDLDSKNSFDPNDKVELRKLLIYNPKLLQRPILIHEGNAVIGRPPEQILTLLHEV